mgnify:FL=1
MTGPKLLIACVDSELRNRCFDEAAALGLRVDAVGNQKGLTKRLSKDSYDLVIHQGALEFGDTVPENLLELQADDDLKGFKEKIESLIEVPEFDPESVGDLPSASSLPWKPNEPARKKLRDGDGHNADAP